MLCAYHVLYLVVQEGEAMIADRLWYNRKTQQFVTYVRQLPKRWQTFKEYQLEEIAQQVHDSDSANLGI